MNLIKTTITLDVYQDADAINYGFLWDFAVAAANDIEEHATDAYVVCDTNEPLGLSREESQIIVNDAISEGYEEVVMNWGYAPEGDDV